MNTEDIDRRFVGLDEWEMEDVCDAYIGTQRHAVEVVAKARASIAESIDSASKRLQSGDGRLIYVGAGTSGRIAVQDRAELAPTFGWSKTRVAFVLAGGATALLEAQEGVEDDVELAQQEIEALNVSQNDVAIALAASGNTPFTNAAAEACKAAGALVIGITNNFDAKLHAIADISVTLPTGAELIGGSTRLAAGTAQKLAVNAISTGIMIRDNRIYDNLMVDVVAMNTKLRRRSLAILAEIIPARDEEYESALARAEGNVKIAVLILMGLEKEAARAALEAHRGNLRAAMRSFV